MVGKMIPRNCRVKDDPPNSYGDCIRACIATLIDRDDVPHVFDGRSALQAWRDIRAYLAGLNKTLFLFPVIEFDPHELMKNNNSEIPYMLLGATVRGDHAVICRDGKVVHDPSWYKSDIIKPGSVGFWVIGIIGDLV